ncbi:glycosyltransferase family 2 protein [Cyanobium sp. HWJ4-Hawea]|uniref:glycosyltransferase family 2 protein n=1 Tax=Cyanobium sp. HWJ4-Hawea TaxID=2823713 RepID=UPI0020CC3715|nr:glycosyltransferase family 2 protein [Cyanobium sp. HWJ4-Hawea]MCP9809871.1 glycosyltransferase family 2 protein [Cyanobium sp. HWJ4-Hawea]
MGASESLTAILISRNAAETIGKCLASLNFCQSIVIVDGGSTDQTVDIARSFGAVVIIELDWQGFGVQKQRALDLVNSGWVFSIDCDEVVPAQLAKEIKTVLSAPKYSVYRMPRLNHLCGRAVRVAGWYPDYVNRLFLAGSARFNSNAVHESLVFEGSAGILRSNLLHYTYSSYGAAVEKMNAYSSIGAESLRQRRRSINHFTPVLRALYRFLSCYFLRFGFLGGIDGLTVSSLQAFGTYLKYLKALD